MRFEKKVLWYLITEKENMLKLSPDLFNSYLYLIRPEIKAKDFMKIIDNLFGELFTYSFDSGCIAGYTVSIGEDKANDRIILNKLSEHLKGTCVYLRLGRGLTDEGLDNIYTIIKKGFLEDGVYEYNVTDRMFIKVNRIKESDLYIKKEVNYDVDFVNNRLTQIQMRIFKQAITGISAKEIALVLKENPKTISNHLTIIYKKLGVKNKQEFKNIYCNN